MFSLTLRTGLGRISSPRRAGLQAFSPWALLALLVAGGCSFQTRSSRQREHLASLRPAAILGQTETSTRTQVYRVRVYVDPDHALQVPDFEPRFRAQLERANRTLRAAIDAELELVEFRLEWRWREQDAGLDAALRALARADPAQDVDWVIGLVAALPLTTPSYHELGRAFRPGRHLVLRGMDDPQDLTGLERVADALERREILAVYGARLRHRETSVLLHELAHSLGADHVEAEDTLMSAIHSLQATRFSSETVETMRNGLLHRPEPGTALAEESSEDQRAQRLLDRGRPEDAIALLEPLANAGLATTAGLVILCEALARDPAGEARAGAACLRAGKADPRSPTPSLVLAKLAFAAKRTEEATQHADVALLRLEESGAPSPHGTALASVFRALSDLVATERTLPLAEDSAARDNLHDWTRQTRRRLAEEGLDEAEASPALRIVIRNFLQAETRCSEGAYDEGLRQLRKIPAPFRERAFVLQLECNALLRAGKIPAARRVCQAAAKRYPEAPSIILGLARVEAAGGRVTAAVKHLERAILVAPEGHEVFALLVALYRAMGREEALTALAELHQRRFAHPLP